jgi:hypothetical protein
MISKLSLSSLLKEHSKRLFLNKNSNFLIKIQSLNFIILKNSGILIKKYKNFILIASNSSAQIISITPFIKNFSLLGQDSSPNDLITCSV